MQVKDRLVVVTGGARRLGRALVEGLAADGARPVIHYHESHAAAQELAHEVGGVALQADLSRPEGAGQLAREVLALDGELAAWINAAAGFERVPFLDSDDELWRRTLQLVLLSPAALARRVAPAMVDGGVLINILDAAAQQPWKGYAHHCTAKAGLLMLTRTLARELAPRLRVCAISPGVVLLPEGPEAEAARRMVRRVPLGRVGEPGDVVQAARYLLAADYLTGAVIPVDGGLTTA